jgi:hypothetical protein
MDALQTAVPMVQQELEGSQRSTSSLSAGQGLLGDNAAPPSASHELQSASSPETQAEGKAEARIDAGVGYVSHQRTPIKAIKVTDSEEYSDVTTIRVPTLAKLPNELLESEPRKSIEQQQPATGGSTGKRVELKLKLLIAEDDPINMKIMRKRLEKKGHEVFHAGNGEECAALYAEKSDKFDVILMDMQVCFPLTRI